MKWKPGRHAVWARTDEFKWCQELTPDTTNYLGIK